MPYFRFASATMSVPAHSVKTLLVASTWIAVVLNIPTTWDRAETLWRGAPGVLPLMGPLCEMAMIFGVTLAFLTLAQMFGRIPLRAIASSFFIISAICAYYMTRFKVIIGYGVMNAVITTDHDMSREVVGLWTLLWLVLLGLLPAIWFWRRASSAGILSCWRSGRW